MHWDFGPEGVMRHERHFDDRVMPCFAARPSSPYQAFERALAARPEAEAVVAGELRLSYAALEQRAARVAAGLAQRGLGAGDRVALLLGNRIEFVITLLATLRLGAIAVPMGTRLQTPELAYILQHSGAKLLVHDAELALRLPPPADVPALGRRIAVGGPADVHAVGAAGRAVQGSERFEQLEGSGAVATGHAPISASISAPFHAATDPPESATGSTPIHASAHPPRSVTGSPPVHAAPEDSVAVILYTSGTTGRPKGAMLTQLNLVHSMLNYAFGMRVGPDDRTLMAAPASHVTGLVANVMLAWAAQCTLVILAEFKVRSFLELAARERMTHTVMVPAMYQLCLLQPDFAGFDLHHWRAGGYGGAPMAEATIAGLAQSLPGLGLHNVYGSTETSSPVTMLPARCAAERPDSVGLVLPGADIVVMDEQGRELPRGSSGELWIRGPMVVPGYWADAEATRKGFVAGYWLSGDIGSIDEQGFVRVLDRAKDMLNRGGFKIYSVEVENVLLQHPAVVEAAIVGKPDAVLTERVHAFVGLKPGYGAGAGASVGVGAGPPERHIDLQQEIQQALQQELQRFCAARLADYKVPETWTLTRSSLPRNSNGKLLKRELRQQIIEQETR
jgi:long-chain acyl-CoA synthetase